MVFVIEVWWLMKVGERLAVGGCSGYDFGKMDREGVVQKVVRLVPKLNSWKLGGWTCLARATAQAIAGDPT